MGIAERLAAAGGTIHEIAEDLRTHMKGVGWQGEAGDAFRNWGADTANATNRLGYYSQFSSTWLAIASATIADVKSAMPQDATTAKGNLDAAREYRNDPDSAGVARDAQATLGQDDAAQRAAHQDAIQQMKKLAETYSWSASGMSNLEVPTFPPPPGRFMPSDDIRYGGEDLAYPGGAYASGSSGGVAAASGGQPPSPQFGSVVPGVRDLGPAPATTRPEHAVGMEIDSIATLPPVSTAPSSPPVGLPGGATRPEGGLLPPGMIPPAVGGGTTMPAGPAGAGRSSVGSRLPALPGQGGLGTGPVGRLPRDGGIVGGRPVPPNSGRPTGAIPRGTVIGAEGTHGRLPMAHGAGGASMGGLGGGQSGVAGGRRLASEAGGVVGGRPQQPGSTGARPFTPGGSGLVRGVASADSPHAGPVGRAGAVSQTAHGAAPRRDEAGDRPDYLSEDEETWQQGRRRVVPPVID